MNRKRDSQRWDSFDRIATALFAAFASAAAGVQAIGASVWVSVLLTCFGVVAALIRVTAVSVAERSRIREAAIAPLVRAPIPVSQLRAADMYDLGVDLEAHESLKALDIEQDNAPYVARDCDRDLREDLAHALRHDEATLVVVTGHSKAGKSRTALEAIRAATAGSWLVVPRPLTNSIAELSEMSPPVAGPVVIWLDDLEPWVGLAGLSPQVLGAFRNWNSPVLLIATAHGKGVDIAGVDGERFQEPLRELLARSRKHHLASRPTPTEEDRLHASFGEDACEQVCTQGIGEFFVAAPRLIDRLELGANRTGQAIVRAAIECRRAGVLSPVSSRWLQDLYWFFLDDTSGAESFEAGLRWATQPIYRSTALLRPTRTSNDQRLTEDLYEPFDFLVDHIAGLGKSLDPLTWNYVIEHGRYEDLLAIGLTAAVNRDFERVERALLRDDDFDGKLATVAGLLFRDLEDLDRAEAALRRGTELGDVIAPNNLGALLAARGDLVAAERAYRLGDERGDGRASAMLGDLLRQRGDLDGAEAAYRRGDQRGSVKATTNLGTLLDQRGDAYGAEEAFRRADAAGDRYASYNLSLSLSERGDAEGAEAALRRADKRELAEAAFNLGRLLHSRGDVDAAEAAYRRAVERGSALAPANLGALQEARGDKAAAASLYRLGVERGNPTAMSNLGALLDAAGDLEGAEAVLRTGDDMGDARCAYNLGIVLFRREEYEMSKDAFRRGEERGHGRAAHMMRNLFDDSPTHQPSADHE